MQTDVLTPAKAAFRLTNVLNQIASAHGEARFPVDVEALAQGVHELFKWKDPITSVVGTDIPGFDGCLSYLGDGKGWALLYNDATGSRGRIRFTQAHELGHYILHRSTQQEFHCTSADMDDWQADEKKIETEADSFAANLLMPLDDFRKLMSTTVDFEQLGDCTGRYGVSLTAAALRWVSATDKKLVLVASTDGFMNWSYSSDSARVSGAFFRARKSAVEIPSGTLAADSTVAREEKGVVVPANTWFPNASRNTKLREMKITSEQYGVLTLLELPSTETVWEPWQKR
ncbi:MULTISPECIES: ImmA/IrrE family metallo-endopeptidase [unclassified Paraburkholderia]|uniref:ImmA/IrrE family metallo-endopeptidase n=1 Tax=unclassified Paraburkholderia TaxID=2615204 RepID=UPI002AB1FE5A|nr:MULTISPECIES: ImmA/IrrE family metallo-endopeptidase [unclassified Paraburkholderia]